MTKIRFNPFTGQLDLVKPDNFSYETIKTGKTLKIPLNQQMIVHDTITLNGDLILKGQLVVFD